MNIDKSSWIHLPLSQNPQIHLPSICMHLHHRELILKGKCDIAPGHKNKQFICQLAECIQLKPVQATKTYFVNRITVHSNIKTAYSFAHWEGYCILFVPKSYIAKLSTNFTLPLLYVFSVEITLLRGTYLSTLIKENSIQWTVARNENILPPKSHFLQVK